MSAMRLILNLVEAVRQEPAFGIAMLVVLLGVFVAVR